MYDVKIFFPDFTTGKPNTEAGVSNTYPITVRATGFTVPDVEVGTYEIGYHGQKVNRPSGEVNFTRSFDITFREDAAFMLRQRFSLWMMAVADPVSGGVSNAVNYFGTLSVRTIAGEYTSTQLVNPTGKPTGSDNQILKDTGQIPEKSKQGAFADVNPVAEWNFYHVWVSKVGGVEFSTDAAEANTFPVTFQYQDCDIPFFGGNPIF
jgi:hypothetical protein